MGALSITGLPGIKPDFEPLVPSARPGAEHQLLPAPRPAGPDARERGVRPVGRRPHRRGHRVRGPGHGRRGLPRAGAERRRLLPAAARILPAGPGDLRPVRRAARLRRGDLRVRPARRVLRRHPVRLPARHHHLRQGHDQRVRAARRDDRVGPAGRAVPAAAPTGSRTASPSAATRSPARSPWPTSTSSSARTSTVTSGTTRRRSGPTWSGCSTCRSSATSAATATSTASSWSRTRRPRRPSTTTSPSGCCAGFLSKALFDAGLYCRADDRGDPVVQLAPPLICDETHFAEIEQILRTVLTEAWTRI